MIFNQKGGLMNNKDGEIFREWKWPGVGRLDNPVIVQVTLKKLSLQYSFYNKWLFLLGTTVIVKL